MAGIQSTFTLAGGLEEVLDEMFALGEYKKDRSDKAWNSVQRAAASV
jgi:hypothetical protein